MRTKGTFAAVLIGILGLIGGCLSENRAQNDETEEHESREQTSGEEDWPIEPVGSGESGRSAESSDDPSSSDSSETSASANSGLEAAEVRGKEVFGDNCATCHGGDARGTRSGPSLRPIAGQLAEGERKSTVRNQISSGGRRMPAFSHLEDDEVDALIAYLRHLGAAGEDSAVATESSEGETDGRKGNWMRGKRRWHGGNKGTWRRKRRGRRRNDDSEENSSDRNRDRGRMRGCRNRRR